MRVFANVISVSSVTIFFSSIALFVAFISPRRGIPWIARTWARTVLLLVGVQVKIRGVENIDPKAAYVIMPNHTSDFDVVCLYATLPVRVLMVAKRELTYIPIFGWALWVGGAIIIDRGDRARAIRSIERAGRSIDRGVSVLLFPEGTRTPEGTLGPLKKGPFFLARGSRKPILPIGIAGTDAILRKGDYRIRAGVVVLEVGPPISTDEPGEDGAVREGLMEAVADQLTGLMARAQDNP